MEKSVHPTRILLIVNGFRTGAPVEFPDKPAQLCIKPDYSGVPLPDASNDIMMGSQAEATLAQQSFMDKPAPLQIEARVEANSNLATVRHSDDPFWDTTPFSHAPPSSAMHVPSQPSDTHRTVHPKSNGDHPPQISSYTVHSAETQTHRAADRSLPRPDPVPVLSSLACSESKDNQRVEQRIQNSPGLPIPHREIQSYSPSRTSPETREIPAQRPTPAASTLAPRSMGKIMNGVQSFGEQRSREDQYPIGESKSLIQPRKDSHVFPIHTSPKIRTNGLSSVGTAYYSGVQSSAPRGISGEAHRALALTEETPHTKAIAYTNGL